MKNTYTLIFSEDQMEFLRQLMQSDIAVTIKAAKLAASVQDSVLATKPDAPAGSADESR